MFIAKLKGKRGQHKIVFSDEADLQQISFYQVPDVSSSQVFNPEVKLEDDEWCYVDLNQDQRSNMLDVYYACTRSSGDHNPIVSADYKAIEALYRVLNNEIIFTKITDGYRVENKKFLIIGEEVTEMSQQDKAIDFSGKVDAYYDGNGKLYFRDFSRIRPLFDGIEDFFSEATQEEKQTFLSNAFFAVDDGLDLNKIGMRAAKRIAALLSDPTLDLSSQQVQQKIKNYAQNYPEANVQVDERGKLTIASAKDLSSVLNLLSGRYYVSEITGEKMLAHGTTKVS